MGVEFASIFNRFGTEVTVLEMLPRMVPVEDEEVSKELERVFKKQRIRVETGAQARRTSSKTGNGVKLTLTTQGRQAGSSSKPRSCWWRWAASRTPRTSASRTPRSNSTAASSRWTSTSRPAEPGVYAIGDVVAGTPQLAHVATMRGHGRGGAHGRQAGDADQQEPHSRAHLHRAGHRQRGPDRGAGARAGLQGEGRQVPVRGQQQGHHPGPATTASSRWWRTRSYGEILGVHIIGPQAFELIAEAVAAMEAEATVETS